jgi:hypothetical protein
MWAHKFIRKETRSHVPKYKTFIFQNHDLLKMWFEDMAETQEDRCSFCIRGLRWLAGVAILFIFTYLVISPQDKYFNTECNKR